MSTILIQSHNWGSDVSERDYELPVSPARIEAVYENMVTGYCGGGDDHPAVGKTVESAEALMREVGKPHGYQHCRLQVSLAAV